MPRHTEKKNKVNHFHDETYISQASSKSKWTNKKEKNQKESVKAESKLKAEGALKCCFKDL